PYGGAAEVIRGNPRYCLWIPDGQSQAALAIPQIAQRVKAVRAVRKEKKSDKTAQMLVEFPHRFRDSAVAKHQMIVVPQVTSENREYLPADIISADWIISFQAYGLFDAPSWAFSIVSSRLHLIWISTACSKME